MLHQLKSDYKDAKIQHVPRHASNALPAINIRQDSADSDGVMHESVDDERASLPMASKRSIKNLLLNGSQ